MRILWTETFRGDRQRPDRRWFYYTRNAYKDDVGHMFLGWWPHEIVNLLRRELP